MSLLDFFRPAPPHEDPGLGSLLYSGGRWRGSIELEQGKRVPAFLPGGRSGPAPQALQLAQNAAESWTRVRSDVASELFEHYNNGRDGAAPELPDLALPSDVWSHVTLSSVEIGPHRSLDEFQVAIRTAWDDEHTLGALIRDGVLVGLNGSILEPR